MLDDDWDVPIFASSLTTSESKLPGVEESSKAADLSSSAKRGVQPTQVETLTVPETGIYSSKHEADSSDCIGLKSDPKSILWFMPDEEPHEATKPKDFMKRGMKSLGLSVPTFIKHRPSVLKSVKSKTHSMSSSISSPRLTPTKKSKYHQSCEKVKHQLSWLNSRNSPATNDYGFLFRDSYPPSCTEASVKSSFQDNKSYRSRLLAQERKRAQIRAVLKRTQSYGLGLEPMFFDFTKGSPSTVYSGSGIARHATNLKAGSMLTEVLGRAVKLQGRSRAAARYITTKDAGEDVVDTRGQGQEQLLTERKGTATELIKLEDAKNKSLSDQRTDQLLTSLTMEFSSLAMEQPNFSRENISSDGARDTAMDTNKKANDIEKDSADRKVTKVSPLLTKSYNVTMYEKGITGKSENLKMSSDFDPLLEIGVCVQQTDRIKLKDE